MIKLKRGNKYKSWCAYRRWLKYKDWQIVWFEIPAERMKFPFKREVMIYG